MGHNQSMTTVFEMIIDREIPGNFVWEDDHCVAILTIEPVAPGHTMVIPREPISRWTDLPSALLDHLLQVAQVIAKAQETAFAVPRVSVVIAGFEVPHTHVHLIPSRTEADCLLSEAQKADPADLAAAAEKIREALDEAGYGDSVPA